MTILLAASLLPPLFLLWKVYQSDKIEKEPEGLLVVIFIAGAISTIPAGMLEMLGSAGMQSLIPDGGKIYNFIFFVLIVGGAEELVKFVAMRICTWKSPEFNYVFDGVVYGVTASLGFAALENLFYVVQGGFSVAGLRAVTSIPLHCITGIFMGHYYGIAKSAEIYRQNEICGKMLRRAVLIPMLIHGAYDFIATDGSELLSILFLVYIILLDFIAIRALNRYSSNDISMF